MFVFMKKQKGFTLIELLVVIAIIGVLSSVVIGTLSGVKDKTRDAKRLMDIKQIQNALDLYYSDYGRYPYSNSDSPSCGGWDTTGDGIFLGELITRGYLSNNFNDPKYSSYCSGYYYYRYGVSYGSPAPFYVIGIKDMETSVGVYFKSPGWSLPGRNWQVEFEWVTGKLE
ncbi:MAG: type II secretion system protein [Candidatus Moranbacteria bacterium]|nr:type II secretion system protein [Candidatus Moranbacteria bacterium]